ncbi:amino acid decarboxylase, partial [Streptomyces sp. AS58]|uniref:pyridoxal phosphate-dependent decarboxylase family protein n=1 Tax=Streptomyces sp. AS58 TaxID=1519489 RepID=UPI0006C4DEBA
FPAPAGTLDPAALDEALTDLPGPLLVAATAGTTDAGLIDPLPEIADRCRAHGARLHIDAAYGGGLLFSTRHRAALAGLEAADTVTLDLHKLGWQPIAAGLLTVRDAHDLTVLHQRADYLNAADDTEAGLPDLLGRSLRTTRRADILKIAVTLRTLGRDGLAALVDQVCAPAREFARLVDTHPAFELHDRPTISTVLFRPADATDDTVAAVRRRLLTDGHAVLGRARLDGRLWLKATLLNPRTRPEDLASLLELGEANAPR